MQPILFELGFLKIYSYGLMVACGFALALWLVSLEARRQALPRDKIINLCLGLIIFGILGARLLYIFQNLKFYLDYPAQVLMLHKGGLSFYGGFLLALIFAAVFFKREHLPALKTVDLLCPYLALAQGLGRLGCLLNGCCYGKPTDSIFALCFPGESIGRYPVQVYSSLYLLLIFVLLRVRQAKRKESRGFPGQFFILYCLLYSAYRFFIEYLRGDNFELWLNLTLHQLFSIVVFVVSAIIWYRYARSAS
jgi:phosphatidylglycerol:prolipoprotein diacylglycerol transferase